MDLKIFGSKKRVKSKNFVKLSSKEQKEIIMKAVKESNKKQEKLYSTYNKPF